MITYFVTIATVVVALGLLAIRLGLVEQSPQRPPIGFWIAIGTVLFLGFVVLPNT